MAKRSKMAGKRALQKKLRALPADIKAALAASLRDCAQRVYDAALPNLPADTGVLRRKFRLFQSKDGLRTRVGAWGKGGVVVAGKKRIPAYYFHLVEFGTKPHTIKMPDGQEVRHPGAKPHPVLLPAYRRNRAENIARIREAVQKALAAAAARNEGADQ